jgi:hypothetical protein
MTFYLSLPDPPLVDLNALGIEIRATRTSAAPNEYLPHISIDRRRMELLAHVVQARLSSERPSFMANRHRMHR